MVKVHRIRGACFTDQIFEITLETGERVLWNVTKLRAAARAGAFGAPRYARTSDLPPAKWESWGVADRAIVNFMKSGTATAQRVLDDPAIAIASSNPNFLYSCFADGQHRITARQELGLAEISFFVVPIEVERDYRVEGL